MKRILIALSLIALASCHQEQRTDMDRLLGQYATVTIPAPDLSGITDNGKEVLRLYRLAADEVDKIYWKQNFGDGEMFLATLNDPGQRQYAQINYGPWDRISGKAFVSGYGAKPAGACFYPADMTADEFQKLDAPDKNSPYTLIERDGSSLKTVWYHDAYAQNIANIEQYLERAADVTIKESVRTYLLKKIEA